MAPGRPTTSRVLATARPAPYSGRDSGDEMPLPRGPRFPTYADARPPASKDRPVLGVGSRVLVTSGNGRSDHVTLTDDSGTSMLGTVASGVEVEIVAWRPRRGGDTRYRVVTTRDRVEGWLGAASLQPRQLPPPPKPVLKPVLKPAPKPAAGPMGQAAARAEAPSPGARCCARQHACAATRRPHVSLVDSTLHSTRCSTPGCWLL